MTAFEELVEDAAAALVKRWNEEPYVGQVAIKDAETAVAETLRKLATSEKVREAVGSAGYGSRYAPAILAALANLVPEEGDHA